MKAINVNVTGHFRDSFRTVCSLQKRFSYISPPQPRILLVCCAAAADWAMKIHTKAEIDKTKTDLVLRELANRIFSSSFRSLYDRGNDKQIQLFRRVSANLV